MATIGIVRKEADGKFVGNLNTLAIRANIRIVPVRDAIGADDFEAVRSLLECRLEPRFLPCSGRRRMCRGDA